MFPYYLRFILTPVALILLGAGCAQALPEEPLAVAQPDLIVENVTFDPLTRAISYTVRNQGSVAAVSPDISGIGVTHSWHNAAGAQLGIVGTNVAPASINSADGAVVYRELAPGETETLNWSASNHNATPPAGAITARVRVDTRNDVAESNEDNNVTEVAVPEPVVATTAPTQPAQVAETPTARVAPTQPVQVAQPSQPSKPSKPPPPPPPPPPTPSGGSGGSTTLVEDASDEDCRILITLQEALDNCWEPFLSSPPQSVERTIVDGYSRCTYKYNATEAVEGGVTASIEPFLHVINLPSTSYNSQRSSLPCPPTLLETNPACPYDIDQGESYRAFRYELTRTVNGQTVYVPGVVTEASGEVWKIESGYANGSRCGHSALDPELANILRGRL